jgi:hypothetical protein
MLAKPFNPLIDETFIFRPLGIKNSTNTLRYADGKWIPDDGEFDLAFVIGTQAFYVEIPNFTNLLWSWSDGELTKKWLPEYLHRNFKHWHYMTVGNTHLEDEYTRYTFPDDDKHPNAIAKKSAMDKCCELHNCASGNAIRIDDGQYDINQYTKANEYIKRELLRIKRTGEPIKIPEKLECVLCANNGHGHLLEALKACKDDIESSIEYSQERINKMQSDIYDEESNIERSKESLIEITEELKKVEDGAKC